MTDGDKDFYLEICKIYFQNYNEYPKLRMSHIKSFLKDRKYAADYANIFEQVKVCHYHQKSPTNVFSYILKPVNSPLLEASASNIF